MKHKVASKNFLKLSLLYVKKVGPYHFYNRKSGPSRKKFGHPCYRAINVHRRGAIHSSSLASKSIFFQFFSLSTFSLYQSHVCIFRIRKKVLETGIIANRYRQGSDVPRRLLLGEGGGSEQLSNYCY